MSDHANFAWVLLIVGLVLVGLGVLWLVWPSLPWVGRLPGDLRVEGEHFRLYFPLATCLLISLILTLALWLVRWLRG